MAKLKTVATALGSLKELNRARTEFDSPSRKFSDEEVFPPADVRPDSTPARTILVRVVDGAEVDDGPHSPSRSQGDVFAIVHMPASHDFLAVLVLNPSVQIESGHTFGDLVDAGGWPMNVAIMEDILGMRVDHLFELSAAALGAVVDELGTVAVYSGADFTAGRIEYTKGTNHLDGASARIFAAVDAVDDAGQTRTRNQRSLLRALLQALLQAGLAQNPDKLASILGHVSQQSKTDAALTAVEIGRLAGTLRQVSKDEIAVVTIPAGSRRTEDGAVAVTFDPEALPALRQALEGEDTAELFRYLVSLGY